MNKARKIMWVPMVMSAVAASVSGRWMRLDGLKEGDFIPLGKGRGRSQLGFESEQARIDDGAGSD